MNDILLWLPLYIYFTSYFFLSKCIFQVLANAHNICNQPNSQIPHYTCPISHNVPLRIEMFTFLFWMVVYCGIWNWCIVGSKIHYMSSCEQRCRRVGSELGWGASMCTVWGGGAVQVLGMCTTCTVSMCTIWRCERCSWGAWRCTTCVSMCTVCRGEGWGVQLRCLNAYNSWCLYVHCWGGERCSWGAWRCTTCVSMCTVCRGEGCSWGAWTHTTCGACTCTVEGVRGAVEVLEGVELVVLVCAPFEGVRGAIEFLDVVWLV